MTRFNLQSALLNVLNRNVGDTDSVIASYLLAHFDQLGDINIYEAAAECRVSRSSIQRFAKSIGYGSFTDMKLARLALQGHLSSLAAYTQMTGDSRALMDQVNEMMEDVRQAPGDEAIARLCDAIHDSRQVFILCANTSTTGAHQLQEEMFLAGRLIRIVTDSAPAFDLLKATSPSDHIVLLSVTGTFAIAAARELDGVKARKVLVTMNESEEVSRHYDEVVLLGYQRFAHDSIGSQGARNVYSRYAMPFFLDLVMGAYANRYGTGCP